MALAKISQVLSLGRASDLGSKLKQMRYSALFSHIALGLLVAGTSFSLAGCDMAEKTEKAIDQRATEAQQALDNARNPPRTVIYDPLVVSNKVWGGGAAIRMQHGMPLPARFESARGVTLVSSEPMSLADIANAVSAQTGIPVRLSALTVGGKSAASSSPGASSRSMDATPTATAATEVAMPMSYEGTLSGLLEHTAASYGVSWHYDGSSISISRYETRIFAVEALPGTQQVNEGMQDDVSSSSGSSGSSGGGGGGGGGSSGSSGGSTNTLTQNSKVTMDFKYWDELTQVLNSVVGGQGSVVVSPSMGTVTVTTTPDIMGTVSDYLAKENKRLGRQIAINVQIYSVNIGQSEDFNIAFTGFLKNLSKFSGLSYASAAVPGVTNSTLTSSALGSLSVAILNGPNDPTAHAGDVFNALSAIGNTTSVAQFPMTTLNNRPVSRRVGTDTQYIATVTQNTTTTTSTSTIYTPVISTIHAGFSLQLTPRLLDDGRILLQYSLSLIGIDSLNPTSFNTGGGDIPLDLPKTDNRIFVQQSMLRSGQTLMIGGVDQEDLAQNKQGVGSPDNFLLGGGTSSDKNHLMMFMAISPQVMDVAESEHN